MFSRKLIGIVLAASLLFSLTALAQPVKPAKPGSPAKPVSPVKPAIGNASEAVLATTAALCFKYQDYDAAVSSYQELLKDYPKTKLAKDYTYYLAMAYERSGDSQKSAELYQDVVTKFKASPFSEIPHIDSLAMEGVGRCFNKNFQEYEVTINGKPITKLEVDAELEKVPPMYRTQFEGEEGRQKFVDRLIERTLLFDEAKKFNPESDPQFYQKLQDAKQDQYIRYMIDKEVTGKAQPSDAEVKKNYQDSLAKYQTPEQVKVRQISLKSQAEAEQALKDLKKMPFDSLARARSLDSYAKSGGDMGLVTRGQFAALDELLFTKIRKGQLSKVIPLEPKFAILKLEDKDKDKLHLRWIVLGTEDEARKLASALSTDPASFDSLARTMSVDPSKEKAGDLGFVTKSDLDEAVFKAASKLKNKGDITGQPVKYYTRYGVFKVEDKIAAGVKPFDQVKGQISSTMFTQKQRQNYENLMKRIKDEAKIEYPKPDSAQPSPEIKPEPKNK